MKTLEVHDLLEVRELKERINEILRMVQEEGETVELTNKGKVIARVVPAQNTQSSADETNKAVWADLKRLSAEISAHWPAGVSAVEAVRDVRRDL